MIIPWRIPIKAFVSPLDEYDDIIVQTNEPTQSSRFNRFSISRLDLACTIHISLFQQQLIEITIDQCRNFHAMHTLSYITFTIVTDLPLYIWLNLRSVDGAMMLNDPIPVFSSLQAFQHLTSTFLRCFMFEKMLTRRRYCTMGRTMTGAISGTSCYAHTNIAAIPLRCYEHWTTSTY